MRHDPLNDAISILKNAEKRVKSECVIEPKTKILLGLLSILQEKGYIGEYETEDNRRGGKVNVRLIKQINDCGIIKPRFPVKHREFDQWEQRFLPAHGFGVLIVSTPKGVMSHEKAKEMGLGGRLIAYTY